MTFFRTKTQKDRQPGHRVQLIHSPARAAKTPVERMIVDLLDREGPKSGAEIVERIAKQIYREELRCGAAALDVGLFGAILFESEVVAALKTGVGVLWIVDAIVAAEEVLHSA
jgi:hypothetical protein